MLIARGLSESLAGRFETITMPHWSYAEMAKAFGLTLDEYIFYGGYPGAAPFINDHQRWRRYVIDGLVETSVSRDVLLLSRIDKPALLRRLFDLACRYSGQQLSYTKMLGQLQDAGNTTTLAHYLDLLEQAAGAWTPEVCRRRSAAAWVESEAAGTQHCVDVGNQQPDIC
jgi:predicted AAA+ superfamily ATPase